MGLCLNTCLRKQMTSRVATLSVVIGRKLFFINLFFKARDSSRSNFIPIVACLLVSNVFWLQIYPGFKCLLVLIVFWIELSPGLNCLLVLVVSCSQLSSGFNCFLVSIVF